MLRYSIWDGSSWTTTESIAISGFNYDESQNPRLSSNPGSDEMVLQSFQIKMLIIMLWFGTDDNWVDYVQ